MLDSPLVNGFVLGMSLIIPIGAQNAYVLRQGALGRHAFAVGMVCSLCDIFLIVLGCMGVAELVQRLVWLRQLILGGGVLFLSWYAYKSLRRAIVGGYVAELAQDGPDVASLKKVVLTGMGFSLLNPHAILDTIVLIGGLGLQYPDLSERSFFVLGASAASVVWFFSLVYLARWLKDFFRKPRVARIFDGSVGCVMLWILWSVVSQGLM